MNIYELKKECDSTYNDYYKLFGVMPPFSPDSNYYDLGFLAEVKTAIAMGKPL